MHVDSIACIRVKGDESESYRIDRDVKQWCIIFLWLFNVYMDTVR